MGIEDVKKDISKIKVLRKESTTSNTTHKRRKVSEDDEVEVPIVIIIDNCDTENPQLRPLEDESKSVELVNEAEKQQVKTDSVDYHEPFRIPEASLQGSKSRSSSEKSVTEAKNLAMAKLPSVVSNSTLATPCGKDQEVKNEHTMKDGKSFDLTNTSIPNNELELKARLRDVEMEDGLEVPAGSALKQDPKVEYDDFMDNEPAVGHLEAPVTHNKMFDDDHEDHDDFRALSEYDDHMDYPSNTEAKANFGLSHMHEPHPVAHAAQLEHMDNVSIDGFDIKEPSFNMYSEHIHNDFMDHSHHDEFHFGADLS